MTPNLLERASPSFRRGYRDGRNGVPHRADMLTAGTFVYDDYVQGYEAAVTEREWRILRAQRDAISGR